MPAAIGPRFALEAGFLVLLAVVVGLADLSPALIVAVMAVGWVLVSLIEYFAWRQTARFPTVQRYATAEAAPAPPMPEAVVEDVPPPPPPPSTTPPPMEAAAVPPVPDEVVDDVPPPPPPPPPPVEEETIIAPAEAEPAATDVEEPRDFLPEREIPFRLEPLKPRPKRRWIIFGPRVRREDDREEEH